MNKVYSVDVRTGESMETGVVESAPSAINSIVAAAASTEPSLAAQSPAERAGMLLSIADALDAATSHLVEAADRETGLGEQRLTGEVGRTSGQFRLFAEVVADGSFLQASIDAGAGDTPELRTMLSPLGVVGVFGASNFPLAFSVPGGDTASALAAGCPVIAKAHPAHPLTSALSLQAIQQGLRASGAPEEAVGLVYGTNAGRHLVESASIHAVGFTGSESVGRLLFDLASRRDQPIPFYGELGSINPVVVLEDTDPQAFGQGLAGSITLGVGQFCTKPGLAFVPKSLLSEVHAALRTALATTVDESGPFVMLTEGIERVYQERQATIGKTFDVWSANSNGLGPTVVSAELGDLDQHLELVTECFGPTTVLVSYESQAELLIQLRKLPGSLTGTVHGKDAASAAEVIAALSSRVGRVVWNGFPTGVRVAWSTNHGGPYPASTTPKHTSVGAEAIARWLRPICYQDLPNSLLPTVLQDRNVWQVPRRVNGSLQPQKQ